MLNNFLGVYPSLKLDHQGKLPIFFEINVPKTIYTDIVGMPANMVLGVTIRYYNSTTQALYFKFFVSGTGWSSNSQELGSLAAGGSAYRNFDDFTSRSTPASETEDTLHFELKAYTDAGYTDEVFSFSRDTTVKFIKSDDGSWTLDEHDTFETDIEGWAQLPEYEGHGADYQEIAISADTYIQGSKSLRVKYHAYYGDPDPMRERRERIYKSFTTPDRNIVYAIINVRVTAQCLVDGCPPPDTRKTQLKYLNINYNGGTPLIHLGKTYDGYVEADYFPRNKWMRLMVPLPKDSTIELRVVVDVGCYAGGAGCWWHTYLDDIKIISK